MTVSRAIDFVEEVLEDHDHGEGVEFALLFKHTAEGIALGVGHHLRTRRQWHDRHLPQLLPFPPLSVLTWWLVSPSAKFFRMIWMSAWEA